MARTKTAKTASIRHAPITLVEPLDEDIPMSPLKTGTGPIKLGNHTISSYKLDMPDMHDIATQTSPAASLQQMEDLPSPVESEDAPPVKEKTAKEIEFDQQIENLAVPGFKVYPDGVFTIIKREASTGRSFTFPARMARWILSSDKWLPYMYRFLKESVALSPYRMGILLLSRAITSLAPAARLWTTSRMLVIVQQAIETGYVNKTQLALLAALGGLLSTGISRVKEYFARNAGILERHFEAMITSRLLTSMARLDLQQHNDPETMRIFADAAGTVNSSSDQAFKVIADVVKVFTSAVGALSQMLLLKSALNRSTMDLVMISFGANLIRSAEWLFRGDAGVQSAVTNPHYQRMQSIFAEAKGVGAEDMLLGLPGYYSKEYNKANEKLGDLWTYRLLDKSRLARTTGLLKDISDPLVYALFAVRAASRRTFDSISSGVFQDTFSMGTLAFIQEASSGLADQIAGFFYTVDDVRQHCTEVLQFYKALEIQPLLKQPSQPLVYQTAVLEDKRGMEVELRSVSYKYPGSEREALDKISFIINPGSLVCVVGFNGSGKSTLVNLICRIVDPTSGTVLINGHDAKDYTATDLYHRIAVQFQQTLPVDVTLREFLHMGDVTDSDDEAKMKECIEIAGIDKVIARFPKGLDARLGPYPADDTPQTFLRDYVTTIRNGEADPWEIEFRDHLKREIEEEEQFDDEVIGGAGAGGKGNFRGKDCAFSPGEWQKLCFARTLMKRNADLRIFDEPSASLDPLASRAVFDKIESLRGKSTVIHITHDLAACIKADQVIMFDDGALVECGTHQELLNREASKYRAFYMAHTGQEEGEEPDQDDDDTCVAEDDEDEWEEEEGDSDGDQCLCTHTGQGLEIAAAFADLERMPCAGDSYDADEDDAENGDDDDEDDAPTQVIFIIRDGQVLAGVGDDDVWEDENSAPSSCPQDRFEELEEGQEEEDAPVYEPKGKQTLLATVAEEGEEEYETGGEDEECVPPRQPARRRGGLHPAVALRLARRYRSTSLSESGYHSGGSGKDEDGEVVTAEE